jgi:chromate reductase, NAD(P)H dehydrogenase (quinone)
MVKVPNGVEKIMSDLTILGISGSLRKASYNSALLRTAGGLLPDGVTLEIYEGLRDLPHYDQDLDGADAPATVLDLRARIGAADGLLIASPEYNYSVPGALKNALDWASRPAGASALQHKLVAIMGASGGVLGTVRGQLALRDVLHGTHSPVVRRPEIFIGGAGSKFDAEGNLTDEFAVGLIRELIVSLTREIEASRAVAGLAVA